MGQIEDIMGKADAEGEQRETHGGMRRLQRHGVLVGLVMFGLVGAAASASIMLSHASRSAAQVHAADTALMYTQRMIKAASTVRLGSRGAGAELRESVAELGSVVANLRTGDGGPLVIASADVQPILDALWPMIERAEKNADILQNQEEALVHVDQALRAISSQSTDLLEGADAAFNQALLSGSQSSEVSACGQLVMLTQRIGKSANELLTQDGISPTAVFFLAKDLNSFSLITESLLNGNPDLRLNGVRDPSLRERLRSLLALYEQTREQGSVVLRQLQGMVAAREAQIIILKDSEPLLDGLEQLAVALAKSGSAGILPNLSMGISMMALLAGTFGFMRLHLHMQDNAASPPVAEHGQPA